MSTANSVNRYPILAESNGHRWVKPDWTAWEHCRECGIVRRTDDNNKPCPGVVRLSLRDDTMISTATVVK